jgi:hypothetical protein
MAHARRRQPGAASGGATRVIEDQKPARMADQPREHRRGGGLLIGQAALGQTEGRGKLRAVGHQRGGIFGAQPPHGVIIGGVAAGVL